jgi:methylthioadenosine phosphorylase (EC 2.4.2.28)
MGECMVKIGIIGGSGMYSLLENADEVQKETEYGAPSDNISVGSIEGVDVAFIPRHGKPTTYRRIRYRIRPISKR